MHTNIKHEPNFGLDMQIFTDLFNHVTVQLHYESTECFQNVNAPDSCAMLNMNLLRRCAEANVGQSIPALVSGCDLALFMVL